MIDGALGVIETGTWNVAEAVAEQPWLPDGPIPTTVTWARPGGYPAPSPASGAVGAEAPASGDDDPGARITA